MSETQQVETEIRMDFWAIALPEKGYWQMEGFEENYKAEDIALVKEIEGLHYFDRNRKIHICSFTASYELFPYDVVVTFDDAAYVDGDLNNDLRPEIERLRDEIEEEWRKATEPTSYMNVYDIERLIEKGARIYHFGDPYPDGQTLADWAESATPEDAMYEDACAGVREYLQGNGML